MTGMLCFWCPRQTAQTGKTVGKLLLGSEPIKPVPGSARKVRSFLVMKASDVSLNGGDMGLLVRLPLRTCAGLWAFEGYKGCAVARSLN